MPAVTHVLLAAAVLGLVACAPADNSASKADPVPAFAAPSDTSAQGQPPDPPSPPERQAPSRTSAQVPEPPIAGTPAAGGRPSRSTPPRADPPDQPPLPGAPIAPFPVQAPDPQNELVLLVPTDARAPQTAATPPPALIGGTLLVTADGRFAAAADPDRGRVSVVELDGMALRHTLEFQAGDRPARLAEDGDGRLHVTLRGAGAVASFDPGTGRLLARSPVCPAPRGLAYDARPTPCGSPALVAKSRLCRSWSCRRGHPLPS